LREGLERRSHAGGRRVGVESTYDRRELVTRDQVPQFIGKTYGNFCLWYYIFMKKLLCFDLDGTLTPHSTWEVFNTCLGISQEDDYRLFTQYKEGNLDYKDWIQELLQLYKKNVPVTKETIESAAAGMEIRPGAQQAIDAAKAKGYHVVILSGAINTMTEVFAKKLTVDDWYAVNQAVFNDTNELIDITDSGHERDAKLTALKRYCEKHNYVLSEVIAVGDGGNDLEIFKFVKGILLCDNVSLMPLAWKHITTLSELNNYL
jgi:HAD superfamily phosphoserine phosphatase-like hydrolase